MPRPPLPSLMLWQGANFTLGLKNLEGREGGGVASSSLWQGGTSNLDMRLSLSFGIGRLLYKGRMAP
jgi:hypothetical protein